MEVLLRKSKESLLMSTENLPQKSILKLSTNFAHVFLKLILLSLRSSTESTMNLMINLPVNSLKINSRDAGHISEAQKIYQWSIM
jgi:hypothetical protein